MQPSWEVVEADGFLPYLNHFPTLMNDVPHDVYDNEDYRAISVTNRGIYINTIPIGSVIKISLILNHMLSKENGTIRQYHYIYNDGDLFMDVDINLDNMSFRNGNGDIVYFVTSDQLRRMVESGITIQTDDRLWKNGRPIDRSELPFMIPAPISSPSRMDSNLPLDINTLPTSGNSDERFPRFPQYFRDRVIVIGQNILERRLGSTLPYLLIKTNSSTTRILKAVLPSEEQRAILSTALIKIMSDTNNGFRTTADGINYDVYVVGLAIRPFDDSYIGYFVSTLDPRINQNVFSLNPDGSINIADVQGRPFIDWPPY